MRKSPDKPATDLRAVAVMLPPLAVHLALRLSGRGLPFQAPFSPALRGYPTANDTPGLERASTGTEGTKPQVKAGSWAWKLAGLGLKP
jgi:hypothetical protein